MNASAQYFRERKEARYQGAWAFMDQEPFNKNNIITDGMTIYSYGRHFPMAVKLDNGDIVVNEERYSVTTSKHQGALRTVLGICGFGPTDEMLGYGRIWRRS
jgi:hypothetical protein